MRTLPLLAALTACSTTPPPEPLDAAYAELLSSSAEEFEDLTVSGDLSVSGSASDYTLTFQLDGGEPTAVDVHTAAGLDLSALGGRLATAELLTFGFSTERSLILSDDAGPLYVLDAGFSMAEVNAALGAERLQVGEAYATDRDRTWEWAYTQLLVNHDDGVAVLLPGDVVELRLDGALWRVAVLTQYDRTARPNAALPGCPVLEDMLSYELLRVEEAAGDTLLAPLEGVLDQAHVGCG